MVCLDSDIIIDFLRNEVYAVKLINLLKLESEVLSTTSVNSFEILNGLNQQEEKIKSFLNLFKILSFDYDCSIKASEIFKSLKESGNVLDTADIIIASICIKNKQGLITRNKKHFERINGLELVDF